MKLPKDVKLIESHNIRVTDKDEIEIANERDFLKVLKLFDFKVVFKKRYKTSCEYNDYYYLIGTEVMYIYNEVTKND